MIDFFILGAPKAGTTALHSVLNQHPDVFLPSFKEPHFFAEDMGGYKAHSNAAEFMRLYENEDEKIKGDASVFNLYSDVAVPNILKHNPNAKFIVCLRRQVDTVPSFHAQVLFTQDEQEESLSIAWDLVEHRNEGNNIPSGCKCSKVLNYKSIYRYGEQLERLNAIIDANNLLIIFHEDLLSNPLDEYEKILAFIGAEHQILNNETHNANEVNRFPLVTRVLRHPPDWLKKIKRIVMGRGTSKIYESLLKANSKVEKRKSLDSIMRAEIINNYIDDIKKLELLLGRKLPEWYRF